MVYFTGVRWGGGERLFAVIVPADGEAIRACAPPSKRTAPASSSAGGPSRRADVLTWQEHESPYAGSRRGSRPAASRDGRMGAEETVQFRFTDGLAQAAPAPPLVSGTPVTAGCRGVKSAHEIALMQLANEATLTAYKAVYLALRRRA